MKYIVSGVLLMLFINFCASYNFLFYHLKNKDIDKNKVDIFVLKILKQKNINFQIKLNNNNDVFYIKDNYLYLNKIGLDNLNIKDNNIKLNKLYSLNLDTFFEKQTNNGWPLYLFVPSYNNTDKIKQTINLIENVKYMKVKDKNGKLANTITIPGIMLYFINKNNKLSLKIPLHPYIKRYLYNNFNKYYYKHSLITYSKPYRIKNIKLGIESFLNTYGNILDKDITYSIAFGLKRNLPLYVDGYVLKYNAKTKKIEEVKEKGGGLCGVSTIFFTTLNKIQGIDIIERHNHSNFYNSLYGYKKYGEDASIYFGNNFKSIYKDFKFKNNIGKLYIKPFYEKRNKQFIYGLEIYSLEKPLHIGQYKLLKQYTHKNNKCFISGIFINNKLINKFYSCYRNIY